MSQYILTLILCPLTSNYKTDMEYSVGDSESHFGDFLYYILHTHALTSPKKYRVNHKDRRKKSSAKTIRSHFPLNSGVVAC